VIGRIVSLFFAVFVLPVSVVAWFLEAQREIAEFFLGHRPNDELYFYTWRKKWHGTFLLTTWQEEASIIITKHQTQFLSLC